MKVWRIFLFYIVNFSLLCISIPASSEVRLSSQECLLMADRVFVANLYKSIRLGRSCKKYDGEKCIEYKYLKWSNNISLGFFSDSGDQERINAAEKQIDTFFEIFTKRADVKFERTKKDKNFLVLLFSDKKIDGFVNSNDKFLRKVGRNYKKLNKEECSSSFYEVDGSIGVSVVMMHRAVDKSDYPVCLSGALLAAVGLGPNDFLDRCENDYRCFVKKYNLALKIYYSNFDEKYYDYIQSLKMQCGL